MKKLSEAAKKKSAQSYAGEMGISYKKAYQILFEEEGRYEAKGTYEATGKTRDEVVKVIDKAERIPSLTMRRPTLRYQRSPRVTPKTPRLR